MTTDRELKTLCQKINGAVTDIFGEDSFFITLILPPDRVPLVASSFQNQDTIRDILEQILEKFDTADMTQTAINLLDS